MGAKTAEIRLESIDQEYHVPAPELARLLKITDNEIYRLCRSNVMVRIRDPENRRAFLYPLFENITRYTEFHRSKREAIHQDFLKAKAARERAVQLKVEMENKAKAGQLVDKAKLVPQLENVVIAYREQLLARSDRLAREIAFAKGLKAKSAKIKAADIDALHVLSDLFKVMGSNGAKEK